MEPEGSLPCSQELVTVPSCEPFESSPHLHTLVSSRSIQILSLHVYLPKNRRNSKWA